MSTAERRAKSITWSRDRRLAVSLPSVISSSAFFRWRPAWIFVSPAAMTSWSAVVPLARSVPRVWAKTVLSLVKSCTNRGVWLNSIRKTSSSGMESVNKVAEAILCLVKLVDHAAAGVEQDAHTHRGVLVWSQGDDCLRNTVLIEAYILFLQPGDVRLPLISHCDRTHRLTTGRRLFRSLPLPSGREDCLGLAILLWGLKRRKLLDLGMEDTSLIPRG